MSQAASPSAPPPAHNLWLLVGAQALGGASPPIIIALGGLVGQQLSATPTAATLPVSLYQLGLALSTLPAAWLMQRTSRRTTYVLAAALAAVGGVVAAQGVARGSFVQFCLGLVLAGFYAACVHSYRFAATDSITEPGQQARAISMVMAGGLAAAIIGPQMVVWTDHFFPIPPFVASFYGQSVLALLALVVLLQLRLPPVQVKTVEGPARPLWQIARTPAFVVAAVAGVVSYGLMSFLMTAAPMAMVACGHSGDQATLGIQWHVLAMFAPSFFTGRLIARFGKKRITALGLVLIGCAALMALGGLELLHFWGALIFLGLGWNFGFIGATSLLTDCYTPQEARKVQMLNDFLVFGTVATASFGSGQLLHRAGWDNINLWMLPMIAAVLLLLSVPARRPAGA